MSYYKNTFQTPNEVIDDLMKQLPSSELKVLLFIIRRTYGMLEKGSKYNRVRRAWISQKLFRTCCNLSGRAVSTSIDNLAIKEIIEVTDSEGELLNTKQKRRGKPRLYFACRLRLAHMDFKKKKKACEQVSKKPVNTLHIIKPTMIKPSCAIIVQGVQRISDKERIQQILQNQTTTKPSNTY